MKILLLFLLALVPLSAAAQNYHTTAEQMKILEESKLMYRIGASLDSMEIEYDTYSQTLILAGAYIDRSGGRVKLGSYNERREKDQELEALHNRAEVHFAQRNYDSARVVYQTILDRFPDNSNMMTYIGQTYGIQEEFDKAKEWYLSALKTNPVDYLAHWFLADIYKREENYDDAVKHITLAHLLNRNNPRLMVSLIDIYALNETPYDAWTFRPLYALKKGEAHYRDIGLSTDKDSILWMGYALCKALWAFEPGYADSTLAGSNEPPFMIEERECLISLATGLLGAYEKKPAPMVEFRKLLEAIENENFDSFLIYEIILRREPSIAMLLSSDALESLAEYVEKYHTTED